MSRGYGTNEHNGCTFRATDFELRCLASFRRLQRTRPIYRAEVEGGVNKSGYAYSHMHSGQLTNRSVIVEKIRVMHVFVPTLFDSPVTEECACTKCLLALLARPPPVQRSTPFRKPLCCFSCHFVTSLEKTSASGRALCDGMPLQVLGSRPRALFISP